MDHHEEEWVGWRDTASAIAASSDVWSDFLVLHGATTAGRDRQPVPTRPLAGSVPDGTPGSATSMLSWTILSSPGRQLPGGG
jgi:hypothetical protein